MMLLVLMLVVMAAAMMLLMSQILGGNILAFHGLQQLLTGQFSPRSSYQYGGVIVLTQ